MKKALRLISFSALLSAIIAISGLSGVASAVSAADWQAGRIIDDVVFENSTSMSVQDIQNFLNGKIYNGSCDKYGQRTLESGYWAPDYNGDGRVTHGEYAKYRGYGDNFKFTCLKDYYEVPKTAPGADLPVNNYGQYNPDGSPVVPAGSKSAAQLIYDTAQRYRISPKALLIKIATESAGPLTSDDWPFPKQYYYAMGAHCPDTPDGHVCDPDYAGFSIQVDEGASLIRDYLDNMTQSWWPYKKPYQTNSILWQDVNVRDCGSGPVYIETKATAALYTYTPYQPNDAALRNMYGTGDECSTYGNRNFWRAWNDWFGNTHAEVNLVSDLNISHDSLGRMYTGERTVSFTVRNNTGNTVDLGQIGVASRSPSGRTDGFTMKSVILGAYQTYTYSDTQSHFTEDGDYHFWVVAYRDGVYRTDIPASESPSIVRDWWVYIQAAPTVTSNISVSQQRPTQNANLDISYTVHNNSPKPVDIGDMGVSLIHEDGTNVGMTMTPKVSIPANSDQIITSSRLLPRTGKYFASIVNTKDGKFWNTNFPISANATIARSTSFTAKPAAALQATPSLSAAVPRVGELVSANFKIKNFTNVEYADGQIGLAITDPSGRQVGFAMQEFRIPANGELNYQVPARNFTIPGIYKAKLVKNYNGAWSEFGIVENDTVKTSFSFEVKSNLTLQATPVLSNSNPVVGEAVNASFTLKNYGSLDAKDYPVGLVVIDPNGKNVGFAMQEVTALGNGDYVYNVPSRSFNTPGNYTAWVVQNRDGYWAQYDRLESSGVSARFNFTVKANLSLQQTPAFSTPSVHANELVDAQFKLKNYASSSVTDYPVGLVVIDPNGKNVGFAMQNVSAAALSDFSYSVPSRMFNMPGNYTAWVVQNRDGYWAQYDRLENGGVSAKISFTVKPDATLQSTPQLSIATPSVGQQVTAQFSIKNYSTVFEAVDYPVGLVVIDPNGKNVGFAMQEVKIPAGGTFTYNVPARSFSTAGTYRAWIVQNKNNYWAPYQKVESSAVSPEFQFTVTN